MEVVKNFPNLSLMDVPGMLRRVADLMECGMIDADGIIIVTIEDGRAVNAHGYGEVVRDPAHCHLMLGQAMRILEDV